MTYYQQLGNIPHKRHTQFRQPDGTLYHEELIGLEGFVGNHTLLYHMYPPTAITALEPWLDDISHDQLAAPLPLRHRHLRTANVTLEGDAVSSRIPLLSNQDLCLSIARPTEAMPYWYRFAQGDEVIFVHAGRGLLESQLGLIHYQPGDYLVLPAGTLWRIVPDRYSEQKMLVVEAFGHITPPRQYLNQQGQFLESAPYCERDICPPEQLVTFAETSDFEIQVKTRQGMSRYVVPHHPLDVVGWDGYLWPYRLNIHDFEPITGRIHQPPSVHQTFTGPNFVICSFVPRLFDYHPEAIPAPYNHSNVDSDEVIYYAEGQFMSRKGIEEGSITVHPRGLPHGPQPGLYEASIGKVSTSELAVMVDAFHPLSLTTHATALEDPNYIYSWNPEHHHSAQSPA